MSDSIFLLHEGRGLERIGQSAYESEDLLQALISDHPELLSGDQMNPEHPPSWLLVSREAGVPAQAGGGGRWSMDHLLLDDKGIPTFVEVKRSTDTRIRREVVGQMIEYAANATKYWPLDRIRTLASERLGGTDALDKAVFGLQQSGPEQDAFDIERYWQSVHENLRNGRVRLLFVADELPSELRRIIEFLNEHMDAIEVLGVEVRMYSGDGVRALVPRVIGQTERALDRKGPASSQRKIDTDAFIESCPEWIRPYVRNEVLDEAPRHGCKVTWGTRSCIIRTPAAVAEGTSILYLYPAGTQGRNQMTLEIYVRDLEKSIAEQVRVALTALGFASSGQYTLRLDLVGTESLDVARHAMSIVWDVARGA